MKERPILFSAPMVRALLDGSKTQTRRVVKPQPPKNEDFPGSDFGLSRAIHQDAKMYTLNQYDALPKHATDWDLVGSVGVARIAGYPMVYRCPHGQSGDRLWVRETFYEEFGHPPADDEERKEWLDSGYLDYKASNDQQPYGSGGELPWKPSIFMPRWASRITLEVTGVRVERLQDISEADAIAEGVNPVSVAGFARVEGVKRPAGFAYRELWESINGPGSWDLNPWVWVVEFKRL